MSLPEDFFGRIVFIIQNYGESLLKGAGTTLIIALVGTIIGCLIGLIVGIIQTIPVRKKDNFLKNPPAKFVAGGFFVKNIDFLWAKNRETSILDVDKSSVRCYNI